ncbi:TPA: site-specific integrase [Streptococcus pyogenes]|nr:site-specific integrase [Streptococcus pyogenes]HEQ0516499.1 site-specific integrase [Streptococcus pyogenes]
MPISYLKISTPQRKERGKTMIEKYTKKDGTTAYRLRAYLGVDPVTGKQVRTTRQGFKTEREAKRAEVKLIDGFQRQGAWKSNDKTTFDDVAKLWFEQYQNTVKPSTFLVNQNYYKTILKPHLGQLQMTKITVMICQKFVNCLSRYSGYTLYLSLANRIFKFAVNLGIIDNNPMNKTLRSKCTYKNVDTLTKKYYTKEELNTFLRLVEAEETLEMRLIYRLLSYGGFRIGELIALKDTDFDFRNNTISITKTIAYTKEGWAVQSPKTKKSNRTISMDAETMSLAKLYIKQSIKPLHGSFKLFNFASDTVRKRLDRFILKHGLKRITPHGFRHTHASLLFEAGIPAKIAQERLGHAKIAITMDLYTHLSKKSKDNVADKLAELVAI